MVEHTAHIRSVIGPIPIAAKKNHQSPDCSDMNGAGDFFFDLIDDAFSLLFRKFSKNILIFPDFINDRLKNACYYTTRLWVFVNL